jgi:uncharacterized protein (TIGR03437 family)
MKTVTAVLSLTLGMISARADILVASRDTRNVLAFDETTGAFLRVFTSGGNLEEPESILFGPDGNLYACDRLTGSVIRFNGKTGAFLDTFIPAGSGGLSGPRNLAFSPDGVLFVSSNASDSVLTYNGTTGAFIKAFAQAQGFLPRGIAFQRGEVFIASEGRNQVLHYSASGNPLGVFASDAQIQGPREILFGPDGNLYLSSSANNEVLRFNGTTGAFLNVFASSGLNFPRGLLFAPDGGLFVVSASTDNVQRFRNTGATLGTFTHGGVLSFPTGIAYSPAATGTPTFTAAAVVNAASYAAGLSPGALAVVFGTGLSGATGIVTAPAAPWPTQLAKASIKIGTTDAPIFAVAKVNGQEQINFQVPLELAGQASATMVVTNNGLSSSPVTVPILALQPGIFSFDGVNAAALHGLTNALITPSAPAARGETVVLYLTGMGAVTPPAATNVPASGTTLAFTNAMPTVTFGGISAAVPFSGLAPTFIGLYQINTVVPANAPAGSLDLIVSANGITGKAVKLSIN